MVCSLLPPRRAPIIVSLSSHHWLRSSIFALSLSRSFTLSRSFSPAAAVIAVIVAVAVVLLLRLSCSLARARSFGTQNTGILSWFIAVASRT